MQYGAFSPVRWPDAPTSYSLWPNPAGRNGEPPPPVLSTQKDPLEVACVMLMVGGPSSWDVPENRWDSQSCLNVAAWCILTGKLLSVWGRPGRRLAVVSGWRGPQREVGMQKGTVWAEARAELWVGCAQEVRRWTRLSSEPAWPWLLTKESILDNICLTALIEIASWELGVRVRCCERPCNSPGMTRRWETWAQRGNETCLSCTVCLHSDCQLKASSLKINLNMQIWGFVLFFKF